MKDEKHRGSDWPINIAIILSGVSALVTVFIVTRKHHADWPSEDEIIAFLLFIPNFILAGGCLIYSLTKIVNKRTRGRAVVVLLLSLVMPIRGGYEAYYPKVQRDDDRYRAQEQKIKDWRSLGAAVNPLLREYYLAYKKNCRFPHNDNEVELDGFSEYAGNHGIPLKKGRIVDPWGDPVHFVIAHDGDRVLRARGSLYGIADHDFSQIAVGLILDNPSHVDVGLCQQWALRNGYIPTRPIGRDY